MELKDIVLELASLNAPSGSEKAAAQRFAELVRPYADDVLTDAMGSVIARRACGKKGAKKLLIEAHIDEIGLIVTGWEDGFLKFAPIGGVKSDVLFARQVTVLTEPPRYGIIACMPIHALSAEDTDKFPETDTFCIDVGLTQEQAEAEIPLGTPIAFRMKAEALNGSIVTGKAFDDRASAASLIYAMELLKNDKLDVDVIVVGAVQEEVGCRGAKTAGYLAAPDIAIAVDVTYAKAEDCKNPGICELGKGTAIAIGPNMTRKISSALVDTAKAKGIKYQIEPIGGCSGTDAWEFQVSRSGVATGLLSIPLRYMHTPVETIDLNDAEATAMLIAEFARSLKAGE